MNTENEVVRNLGIHVQSNDPISVSVYMSYMWSGEAFRVIPVEWLGKEYVSINLYQDETDEIKPSQILIIGTEDNTVVQYTPTRPTKKVNRGVTQTVTIHKGQTYLIESKEVANMSQDWETDITGTYVKSTKPIAVVSGHTKGTFPRLFIGMRSGWMEPYANFARNMLTEMLWPVNMLGTEYVAAPLKYYDRKYNENTVIQDAKGDLVRFVAAYDNTEIYQMRQDGSSFKKIGSTMKRGEWYNITEFTEPGYFKANKPFLAAQFGKTWWKDDGMMGPVVEGGKNEKPQNPHLSGQGMLILLAPLSSWCSYANFRSPDGIDNFIYLTFRLDDFSKILFDDVPLNVQWGSSIRTIPGSQFGYIAEPVPPADHWIEGIDGARFAGYAYGNWDRLKDGYAFGYPIGINYSTPCNDSVYITDNMVCGIVNGKAVAVDLQQDTLCAALFNVIFRGSKSQNYSFALDPKFRSGDLEASFTLTPVDPGLPCVGVVEAMTRSGKTLSKTYTYTPEQVAATPSTLDFGLLKVNESKTLQFDVVNPGTVPTVIKSIRLKDNKAEFTMTPDGTVTFPFTLAPGAKQTFYVTALSNVELKQTVYDYVIVGLTCYEREIDTLKLTAGEPVVWIDDAYWDPIPVNTEKPKDVLIENRSDIEVILETITWNDKLHFPRVTNLDLPLTIPPRGTHTFTAYYFADVSGVVHSETAFFTSNADKEKLYSYWEGSGIDAGPVIEGYDWLKRRVIDQWAIDHGTTRYQGTVVINNSGNTPLDYIDLVIKNDPDNVFTLDKGSIPASLQPNTPITVTAWFAPKDEKYYESTVELVTKFAGETKTATATLKGTGIQPHIKVNDLDFVQPIIVGTSKDSMTKVFHITNKEPMELTITGFNIQGADQNAFAILPAWLSNNPTPFKIPIGNVIDVPIKFTAMHSGRHDANLIVSDRKSVV